MPVARADGCASFNLYTDKRPLLIFYEASILILARVPGHRSRACYR